MDELLFEAGAAAEVTSPLDADCPPLVPEDWAATPPAEGDPMPGENPPASPDAGTPPAAGSAGTPAGAGPAELERLRALVPELGEVPPEVTEIAAGGVDLLTAYLVWRARESARAAEALRQENALLRANADRAARAPVKPVTGGDGAPPRGKSPFELGFDAGMDW